MNLRAIPWSTALVLAVVLLGYFALRASNVPVPHELGAVVALILASLPSLLGGSPPPSSNNTLPPGGNGKA